MHQCFRSFFPCSHTRLLLLLCVAAVSLADDAAQLRDVIHAYADNPGDTLILHARVAPGVIFDPEPFSRHKNIAFDTVDISKVDHEINSDAVPQYHGITLCVANLNELSPSQCKDWSSDWSQPVWDAGSNRSCQRGICSIVLLVSSRRIREPECSALPVIHLKKISSVKHGCARQPLDPSTCRLPVFDIATEQLVHHAADPRLELILHHQLDLHRRILGSKSQQNLIPPFPTKFSELKHFFVGQEHIMSDLQNILDVRQFDDSSGNSRVLVLVFAGVSGTGKTMLAGLIASVIHGQSLDELKSSGKFFQQDMGTWQNADESDALFGVKQGIVGEAKLVDLIEKNPNIVVCLDEFSRAHEANRHAFFSAFDGDVQDKKTGKRVKTNRVTFILTTNTGENALLESSGVLEQPSRWNSRHNKSLPEVDSVIQSGMQEFRMYDPMFKDTAFRARIREFFMFLPYSFEMRLEILNMTIARETRTWDGCYADAGACYCYGCKERQNSDKCTCEDDGQRHASSKLVFSHRAKLEILNKLSRQAAKDKIYPNTRTLKDDINKLKLTMKPYLTNCELLEGDGFIIDYEKGEWLGKVVALAENRQAAKEACANKRSNPEQLPLRTTDKQGTSDSPVSPSSSTPPAAPVRSPTPRGAQQELQRDNDVERDIDQRVAQAVAERANEFEVRLKAAEDAARKREDALAAAHAEELQVVKDSLKQVQAELMTWKRRAYALAAALFLAVVAIVILLVKIVSAPLVLLVVGLIVLGLVLLCIFFPQIFHALMGVLWWMWQNPVWGVVILAGLLLIYFFRKQIFNKCFGATHGDSAAKVKASEEEVKAIKEQVQGLKQEAEKAKGLEEKVKALETENEGLRGTIQKLTAAAQQLLDARADPRVAAALLAAPERADVAVAGADAVSAGDAHIGVMFSPIPDSPPAKQEQVPAHTPIALNRF